MHYSNLYYGASLGALCRLTEQKGYGFIGCNSAGNNAYFVRRDKLGAGIGEVPIERGFVGSKFRESRDARGRLTFLAGERRLDLIRGLPVFNVETGAIEDLDRE